MNQYNPDGNEERSGLILGFWEAGIIGTLMIAFFPWSLLFCLVVYGMDYTKALVIALVHDAIKTAQAILAPISQVNSVIPAMR